MGGFTVLYGRKKPSKKNPLRNKGMPSLGKSVASSRRKFQGQKTLLQILEGVSTRSIGNTNIQKIFKTNKMVPYLVNNCWSVEYLSMLHICSPYMNATSILFHNLTIAHIHHFTISLMTSSSTRCHLQYHSLLQR